MQPTIDDVRAFWDKNPLWTGESEFAPGSLEFFEHQRQVLLHEIYGGRFSAFIPDTSKDAKVLDLGCGPGFWTVEAARLGFTNVTGADLSARSIELARQRATIYGVDPDFVIGNAEHLDFPNATFTHVNCLGVIHHTPAPEKAVAEIARVLQPGGTATISVYYRNIILRSWPCLRFLGKGLARFGLGLKGRGRESIFATTDVNEIVRTYDGHDNPQGAAYSRAAFSEMLTPHFQIERFIPHFFPSRALHLQLPISVQAQLNRFCPFMIAAKVRR